MIQIQNFLGKNSTHCCFQIRVACIIFPLITSFLDCYVLYYLPTAAAVVLMLSSALLAATAIFATALLPFGRAYAVNPSICTTYLVGVGILKVPVVVVMGFVGYAMSVYPFALFSDYERFLTFQGYGSLTVVEIFAAFSIIFTCTTCTAMRKLRKVNRQGYPKGNQMTVVQPAIPTVSVVQSVQSQNALDLGTYPASGALVLQYLPPSGFSKEGHIQAQVHFNLSAQAAPQYVNAQGGVVLQAPAPQPQYASVPISQPSPLVQQNIYQPSPISTPQPQQAPVIVYQQPMEHQHKNEIIVGNVNSQEYSRPLRLNASAYELDYSAPATIKTARTPSSQHEFHGEGIEEDRSPYSAMSMTRKPASKFRYSDSESDHDDHHARRSHIIASTHEAAHRLHDGLHDASAAVQRTADNIHRINENAHELAHNVQYVANSAKKASDEIHQGVEKVGKAKNFMNAMKKDKPHKDHKDHHKKEEHHPHAHHNADHHHGKN